VGRGGDRLAWGVVVDVRAELVVREANASPSRHRAKIEHVGNGDVHRVQAALDDRGGELSGVVNVVVDAVPVCLHDHALGRATEVKDFEGAALAPTPAGGAGAESVPSQRAMPLKAAAGLDRLEV